MTQLYTKLILTLFLLASVVSRTNAQTYHWAKSVGGTTTDCGYSIAVDASGNVFTAGAFQGSVDFDPGTGTTNIISSGSFDIFVTKFDASGNFVWAKTMGGLLDDRAYSMALDASGNIYLTGYFKGTVDFDPSATGSSNLTAVGVDDMFICKLTSAGNFVWVKQIGGLDVERGKSINIDAKGNILTTGFFAGTTDFDPSGTVNTKVSAAGTADIFVLKLNSSGDYLWAETFGVSNLDEGRAVTSDATGNIYVTGEYGGSVDFDPGVGFNMQICAGVYDVFVLKLDSVGKLIWVKSFGGQSYDSGSGIAVDAAGNVFTTGLFGDVCDFDPGTATVNLTAAGGIIDKDIFVSKLNSSGNFVWAKRMGGVSDDWATGISLDGGSNVYTTGVFHDSVDFDPGVGVTKFGTKGGFGTDIYISKLDASGNFVYARQVGGIIDDDATSIQVDAGGNYVYVTGEYQEAGADFDPGAAVASLTSLGSYDMFILKLGRYKSGIDNDNSLSGIMVYPNPTSGKLFVTTGNPTDASISIIDIMGNEVFAVKELFNNSTPLDLSNLSSGVYFVKMNSGAEQKVVKLVKE